MTRKRVISALAAVSLVLALAAGTLVAVKATPGARETSVPAVPEPQGVYTLREEGGTIAVYQGGELLYLTDIDVYGLPESDREALRSGIDADGRAEVLRLLEDFSA